jgi:peptidoglycan/LPS O-acetylase OafA/YrhL
LVRVSACAGHFEQYQIAAIVVVAIAVLYRPALLRLSVLTFLGAISYPLYLLHQNIGFIELHWLDAAGVPPYSATPAAMLGVLALTWAIERFVEAPGRRGLRRFLRVRLAPSGRGASS